MAEKLTSSAKKNAAKKIDGKTKEELQWEIRVCKEAVRRRQSSLTTSVWEFIPMWLIRSAVCAVVPFFISLGISSATMGEKIPYVILIALAMGAIWFVIDDKLEKRRDPDGGKECLEVLSERLRIAELSLAALETKTQLSENEKKYVLSFSNLDEPKCGNCAYMGKVLNKTTTTYSDGTTSTSTAVDHYFCEKIGNHEVEKKNVCDYYFSKRVSEAFSTANRYYFKIADILKEEDQKSASGFR